MLVSMIIFLDACCVLYIDSFTRCLFLWFAISSTDLSDSSTYRKFQFSASYTDLVADVLSKAEKFFALCVLPELLGKWFTRSRTGITEVEVSDTD